jgi:signal transduction histidine kinase
VFTRRLAVHLLAPTVLVSLVLVVGCALAAVYLNHLNTHVSADLTENVQSTQVAARLESTTKELIKLLTSSPLQVEKIEEKNQELAEDLKDADKLANLEHEKTLVPQIRSGLETYLERWKKHNPASSGAVLAGELETNVLVPSMKLRKFNTDQIVESDRQNREIVTKLRWGFFLVGVGAPLFGLLLGYAAARSLRHSIYQLSVRIRDAAGRLNRELGEVRLDEEGDLPGMHRQMQDLLVEIERIVDQLQQREREVLRAEQLAAVGQVAAGVAHEMRNPLTSIKMLVQTGLEGTPPSGLPAEDLTIIETEIRRMEQCIRLFIDFARPPRSERRPTDLTEVVRRTLALVEGRAHKQKVTVEPVLPSEKVVVNIDPEQIHQVLLNLMLNSLDVLPHGGKVRVAIETDGKHNGVEGNGAPKGVTVRVQDNGPGIASQIQPRLFEPFVSSKDTGLGLGLSICKRLVEGHGGSIQGQNNPEGGAVFEFTLRE